jgi:S-adenosylmethionine:tRNA ribosyltransferase-isomerase
LILNEYQAFCSSPIKEVYLRIQDFDYVLPAACVATHPMADRAAAKLLLLDIPTNARRHASFRDLSGLLRPQSLVVLNDTRVIPARLSGRKPTGGRVELLLVRRVESQNTRHLSHSGESWEELWEVLLRNAGAAERLIILEDGAVAEIVEKRTRGSALAIIRGAGPGGVLGLCERFGAMPVPPYVEAARKRSPGAAGKWASEEAADRQRYQTVYASSPGAVAAPTAGLHFTEPLLARLDRSGHEVARVTLHVGPGTFRPVETEDPRDHRLDPEWFEVPGATAAAVARARRDGRPVVAVGTTVVRTLETLARLMEQGNAGSEDGGVSGSTDLFLLPGSRFQLVTDLITNFHLPRSTLLMLVAAFSGRERVLSAYGEAIAAGYRFYSYGDAMLLLRGGASR